MSASIHKPHIRIIWFLALLASVITGPFWVAIVLGLLYLILYRGIEILGVAFLVDAFFATGLPVFYIYTLSAMVGLLIMEYVHSNINVYNRDNVS